MEGFFGFLLAGIAMVGSPGPATMSLAATGAAFGVRRGLGFLAGLVTGMILVMGIVATGVMGVMLAWPGVAPVLYALAAAYIVYLAYRIATAPPLSDSSNHNRQPTFIGGVFLNLVNPKAYAVMAALFSGFVLIEVSPQLDAALKFVILLTILSITNTAWLFIGAALTRFAQNPGANRAINITFAILLVASVALALLF